MTMKVRRHRLYLGDEPVAFSRSPNTGGELTASYLIVHYTAGSSAEASVNWLTNPDARASAHLVIGRDGTITQLVAFNRVAWHAGASQWEGLRGLNQHSIGMELDNAGRLEQKGGEWCAWFGRAYGPDAVMHACHRNESVTCGWHVYPPAQIETARRVAEVLIAKYRLKGIAGHDEISPGRKVDPGPAFPMGSFRDHLFGRGEQTHPIYRTLTGLNIRTGPGTGYAPLPEGPLPKHARVELHEERGRWYYVARCDHSDTEPEVVGWVHSAYLAREDGS